MPTFYCNYYFFLLGTRGLLTLGGPLDFAYPAYPIVTPLDLSFLSPQPDTSLYCETTDTGLLLVQCACSRPSVR